MNAKRAFVMGFLSMIATAVLFVALNDPAADAQTTSNSEAVTAKSMADDVKIPETPASQWWVVGAKGDVYLLTPLKTKNGKASAECVPPYTMPTSH